MECECTMGAPARTRQHLIMSPEFEVGVDRHVLCKRADACIYAAACHRSRHVVSMYSDQLLNHVRELPQLDGDLMRNILPQTCYCQAT